MVEKVINVGLHNWYFMYAVVGLVVCDRLGCASIDANSKPQIGQWTLAA